MKNCIRLLAIFALTISCNNFYSQKDTLHIYYQGLATSVTDSNDAKITKWAKKLKGKHADVEIYAYYDNSDFKKFMAERAENLQIVVIRKARDFTTIKFSGAVKGKKSQRIVADIVYTSDAPSAPAIEERKEEKVTEPGASESNTKTESDNSSKNSGSSDKKEESVKKEETVSPPPVQNNSGYYMDSVYVNGVLKVTKRKIKKK